VPLATALCKNLPAENTLRKLSRPKPTRVAVPIEEEEERKRRRRVLINSDAWFLLLVTSTLR